MSSSMVSKNPPPAAQGDGSDDGEGTAAPVAPVTSCLYLHRPGPGVGALDKDAVLRRIRHRRRHNRLRDMLRSMVQDSRRCRRRRSRSRRTRTASASSRGRSTKPSRRRSFSQLLFSCADLTIP
uniref:Uncharacterized protein n=1 Tax=Arundo donax TaxID=35708 RepID=A0A0A8XTL8_ARUDO